MQFRHRKFLSIFFLTLFLLSGNNVQSTVSGTDGTGVVGSRIRAAVNTEVIVRSSSVGLERGKMKPAAKHPQTVIKALALVTRKSVLIRAEVVADDLVKFHLLEPDENKVYTRDDLKKAMIDHQDLMVRKIMVRDENGELIQGKFHNLEPFVFPEAGVGETDLVNFFATYEMEYLLEEAPSFLTFEQDLIDELTLFPSEVHLGIQQLGVSTGQGFVLTPGNPETASFNWDQLPPDRDATDEEWAEFRRRQDSNLYGITNFRSLYSIVHVTKRDVRHEIVIPLAILARTFEIEREEESFLSVEEQEKARPAIKAFLDGGIPLKIDGVEIQPVFERVDFAGLRIKDLGSTIEPERVSVVNGRALVSIRYPWTSIPKQVTLAWNLFPPQIRHVECKFVYGESYEEYQFSRLNKLKSDETKNFNEYQWNNKESANPFQIAVIPFTDPVKKYSVSLISIAALALLVLTSLIFLLTRTSMKVLLISLGFWILAAGLGWNFTLMEIDDPFAPRFSVSDEEANVIAQSLITNVYRAFDYGTEKEIYDALAQSVDGDLLREIYLSVQSIRRVQDQGGATAEIRGVDVVDGTKLGDEDENGFSIECDLTVTGLVGHWGHFHERLNRFTGRYKIHPVDGQWRITGREIANATEPETRRINLKKENSQP